MALRQVNAVPFPYRENVKLTSEGFDSRYYEFERTVFLHGLTVQCSADSPVEVSFSYPSTFTNGSEASNRVFIFSGNVGPTGIHLAPGTVTPGATGPLPAAFPVGSVLQVTVNYNGQPVDAQIFLTASG